MGVRILTDADSGDSCFYCSTSMWAFGPVMPDYETADEFQEWLKEDARNFGDKDLESKYYEFLAEKDKENGGE